jgi:hypothetical protein
MAQGGYQQMVLEDRNVSWLSYREYARYDLVSLFRLTSPGQ